LLGNVEALKPNDPKFEEFLTLTLAPDPRDPGHFTYEKPPYDDKHYRSIEQSLKEIEAKILNGVDKWAKPRQDLEPERIEAQKREPLNTFGLIRESLYNLNFLLNRFLVLGYGLAPVDLSHHNTRFAVYRMTPKHLWERVLGRRVDPAIVQKLLRISLRWELNTKSHPEIEAALLEKPITLDEFYKLMYISVRYGNNEEAKLRVGYGDAITIPEGMVAHSPGRWSAFVWRMHVEDMKISLGRLPRPIVPYTNPPQYVHWPFADDYYDLRIEIRNTKLPDFNRFSPNWTPPREEVQVIPPSNMLQSAVTPLAQPALKAGVSKVAAQFAPQEEDGEIVDYEPDSWESPQGGESSEASTPQKDPEDPNFLHKVQMGETPSKNKSDASTIVQVSSLKPITFDTYFGKEQKKSWYKNSLIQDINVESVKAMKWLVDQEDQRQTYILGYKPAKIKVNWGACLSTMCMNMFKVVNGAAMRLIRTPLDPDELAVFQRENAFSYEDDARILITGLRKLYPEVEVNPHVQITEVYRLHVAKNFYWTSVISREQLSKNVESASAAWIEAIKKYAASIIDIMENKGTKAHEAVMHESHQIPVR